jgi:hypothetical protein
MLLRCSDAPIKKYKTSYNKHIFTLYAPPSNDVYATSPKKMT